MNVQHDHYVATGGCPYVEGKTWCNGKLDHVEQHWATYLTPDGKTHRIGLYGGRKWTIGERRAVTGEEAQP